MLQRQVASAAQAAQDLQLRAAAESKDLHVLAGSIQVPKRFRNSGSLGSRSQVISIAIKTLRKKHVIKTLRLLVVGVGLAFS